MLLDASFHLLLPYYTSFTPTENQDIHKFAFRNYEWNWKTSESKKQFLPSLLLFFQSANKFFRLCKKAQTYEIQFILKVVTLQIAFALHRILERKDLHWRSSLVCDK